MRHKIIKLISMILIAALAWPNAIFADECLRPRAAKDRLWEERARPRWEMAGHRFTNGRWRYQKRSDAWKWEPRQRQDARILSCVLRPLAADEEQPTPRAKTETEGGGPSVFSEWEQGGKEYYAALAAREPSSKGRLDRLIEVNKDAINPPFMDRARNVLAAVVLKEIKTEDALALLIVCVKGARFETAEALAGQARDCRQRKETAAGRGKSKDSPKMGRWRLRFDRTDRVYKEEEGAPDEGGYKVAAEKNRRIVRKFFAHYQEEAKQNPANMSRMLYMPVPLESLRLRMIMYSGEEMPAEEFFRAMCETFGPAHFFEDIKRTRVKSVMVAQLLAGDLPEWQRRRKEGLADEEDDLEDKNPHLDELAAARIAKLYEDIVGTGLTSGERGGPVRELLLDVLSDSTGRGDGAASEVLAKHLSGRVSMKEIEDPAMQATILVALAREMIRNLRLQYQILQAPGGFEMVFRGLSDLDQDEAAASSILRPVAAGEKREEYLRRLEADFAVPPGVLNSIIDAFVSHMNAAPAVRPSSLMMIPIPVRPPTGQETGEFLAVDVGGTKAGAASVTLKGNRCFTKELDSVEIPPGCRQDASGRALFDFVAKTISDFVRSLPAPPTARNAGMAFSFAVKQTGVNSGEILEMGKGYEKVSKALVGRDPVKFMQDAFDRAGLPCRVAGFSNDIVCILMAGTYQFGDCTAAFTFSTGINGSVKAPVSEIRNWDGVEPPEGAEWVPVNIEAGGFSDNSVPRNRYDELLDRESAHPGAGILEKMTGSMYLGELIRLIFQDLIDRGMLFGGRCPEFFKNPYALRIVAGTSAIEKDHSDNLDLVDRFLKRKGIHNSTLADRRLIKHVWELALTRAGRLCAGVITASVKKADPDLSGEHNVVIDSSMFRYHPVFKGAMEAALAEILGDNKRKVRLKFIEDGTRVGAAVIGAVAASGAAEEKRFNSLDLDDILANYSSLEKAAQDGRLKQIVPEWKDVEKQPPIEGAPHQYDVDKHILQVARYSKRTFQEFYPDANPVRRLRICLLHDIGKRGWENFFGDHTKTSADKAKRIMRRLGYDRAVIDADVKIILYHNALDWLIEQAAFPPYLDLEDFAAFLTPENIRLLLAFKIADILGKGKRVKPEEQEEFEQSKAAYIKAADKLRRIIQHNRQVAKRIAAIKKAFFKPGSITVGRRRNIANGVATREVSFKGLHYGRAGIGRAIIIAPGQAAITLWSHRDVMNYDYSRNAYTEQKAAELTERLRHKVQVKPREGRILAEIVKQQDDGALLAACNGSQQNWGLPNGFFIIDGKLIAKPKGICGAMERKWKPLDGDYTVFCFDQDRPGLRTVTIKKGRLINGKDIKMAIAGAAIIKNGEIVFPKPSRRYKRKDKLITLCPKNDETFFDPANPVNNAAFSAVGVDEDGNIVLLHMYGNPGNEMLSGELAYVMARKLKCRVAALMGGSADVEQWTRGDGVTPKIVAGERIGGAEKVVEGAGPRKLGQAILVWQKGRRRPRLFMQPASRAPEKDRIAEELLSQVLRPRAAAEKDKLSDLLAVFEREKRELVGLLNRRLQELAELWEAKQGNFRQTDELLVLIFRYRDILDRYLEKEWAPPDGRPVIDRIAGEFIRALRPVSPEDAQLFKRELDNLSQAAEGISAQIQIIPLTKENVALYAEDLARVDRSRGDEFGEGFWDAARFMEEARASTGTKLDGKWEYSEVVIVAGKAIGYLIGIKGGVKDFGVPSDARHLLRLAIAPAYRNLKIGACLIRNFALKAQSEGVKHIYVDANSKRLDALRFYARCGFEEISRRPYDLDKDLIEIEMRARVEDLIANLSGAISETVSLSVPGFTETQKEPLAIIDDAWLQQLADDYLVVCVGSHPDDVEFRFGGIIRRLAQHNAQIYIAILTSGPGEIVQNGKLKEVGMTADGYRRIKNLPPDTPVSLEDKKRQRYEEALEGARRLGLSLEAVASGAVHIFNFGAGDPDVEHLIETLGTESMQIFTDQCQAWLASSGKKQIVLIVDNNQIYVHETHDWEYGFVRDAAVMLSTQLDRPVEVLVGGTREGDPRITNLLPMTAQDHFQKGEALRAHQSQGYWKLFGVMAQFNRTTGADTGIRTPYVERYCRYVIRPKQGIRRMVITNHRETESVLEAI